MARNKSGGINKLLNFIGLVDDAGDSYQEEFVADGYGRPSTYIPAKQRTTTSRPSASRTPARKSLPAQAGRSNTSTRTYGEDPYEDYRSNRSRSQSRFDDDGYNDYAPSAPAATRRSRFDAAEEPAPRAAMPVRRNARVPLRQRTVMLALHTLEDCCEVIDHLISNDTIVLTMDELDGHLMQRAVDTLSGAVFALHASIRKASDKTYLIAPPGVEVDATYDVDRRF